ncbi:MAG: hypothetical protein HAW61_05250 [Candidatus Portiera sp.]|nr:hypothetical protein [Portiera sp.]
MLDIPLFESPTTSSLPSYHIENTHSFSYNQQSNQALSISSSNSELFYVQLFREIFATLSVDHNKYQVEKDDAQIEEDMDDIDFPLIPPVRTYKVTGRIGKITRGKLAISYEE